MRMDVKILLKKSIFSKAEKAEKLKRFIVELFL